MTDQDAYRRYTTEAERLLELARTPLIITAPARATQQEIDEAAERAKERFGRSDIVVLPADTSTNVDRLIETAGVWATLALAAAQERVQPAGRPLNDGPITPPAGPINRVQPDTVKDGEGDLWYLKANGLYAMAGETPGTTALEGIARMYNGYTEVP